MVILQNPRGLRTWFSHWGISQPLYTRLFLQLMLPMLQHLRDYLSLWYSVVGFPGGSVVKNLPAMQETWVHPLDQEDPLEKETATHLVFLPGKSHRQRTLADYSPWDCKSHTQLNSQSTGCLCYSLDLLQSPFLLEALYRDHNLSYHPVYRLEQ